MLAQIRNSVCARRATPIPLLLVVLAGLSSCATKEQPPLVSDPTARTESSIPWNQQEHWENEGQLGPLSEKYSQGSNRR
jgi:hypothetical protein